MTTTRRSQLDTDRYKPIMAIMGFPLRWELFNLSFRRGGPHYIPVDLKQFVYDRLPVTEDSDYEYLDSVGLYMPGAYRDAMSQTSRVEMNAVPKGSWLLDHEVALTLGAPSALASNVEAWVIGEICFVVNVGTLLKRCQDGLLNELDLLHRLSKVTCQYEKDTILKLADDMEVRLPFAIEVATDEFQEAVRTRATALVELVGDASRVSEGGYRSATCPENHRLVVEAAKAGGFIATSNLRLAREFGMIPAGTTGHEWPQRCFGDRNAYITQAERYDGASTFLLDTYDTVHSGIPSALHAMQMHPEREFGARPDYEPTQEGDTIRMALGMQDRDVTGFIDLSGGFDVVKTRRFLEMVDSVGFPHERLRFLYGEFMNKPPWPMPTRSDLSGVYKLAQSGGRPTMKFSGQSEVLPDGKVKVGQKSSRPGPIRIFRNGHGDSLIGQAGELPPPGWSVLTDMEPAAAAGFPMPVRGGHSPATEALIKRCAIIRREAILAAV